MAEIVNLARFAPLIGQLFRLEMAGNATEEVELIEAKALPARGGAPRQDPFSLVFRARADSSPSQGMARVAHEALGSVELFLVPIGKDEQGLYFQAIFN